MLLAGLCILIAVVSYGIGRFHSWYKHGAVTTLATDREHTARKSAGRPRPIYIRRVRVFLKPTKTQSVQKHVTVASSIITGTQPPSATVSKPCTKDASVTSSNNPIAEGSNKLSLVESNHLSDEASHEQLIDLCKLHNEAHQRIGELEEVVEELTEKLEGAELEIKRFSQRAAQTKEVSYWITQFEKLERELKSKGLQREVEIASMNDKLAKEAKEKERAKVELTNMKVQLKKEAKEKEIDSRSSVVHMPDAPLHL